MSYLDRILVPGERVLLTSYRSPIVVFAAPVAAVLVGLALPAVLFASGAFGQEPGRERFALGLAALLGGVPSLWLGARAVWWWHKRYVVTSLRVLKLEGILNKAHRDASLDKINDLGLQQSLWGRLLRFGDLQIQTANEASGVTYHRLHDPVAFKRQVLAARGAGPTAPVPAEAGEGDPVAQIARLGELRDRGYITEAEFQDKKKALMDRIG